MPKHPRLPGAGPAGVLIQQPGWAERAQRAAFSLGSPFETAGENLEYGVTVRDLSGQEYNWLAREGWFSCGGTLGATVGQQACMEVRLRTGVSNALLVVREVGITAGSSGNAFIQVKAGVAASYAGGVTMDDRAAGRLSLGEVSISTLAAPGFLNPGAMAIGVLGGDSKQIIGPWMLTGSQVLLVGLQTPNVGGAFYAKWEERQLLPSEG